MPKRKDDQAPERPEDFQPLGKDYPLEENALEDAEPRHQEDSHGAYECDDRDKLGRHAPERHTGPFEVIEGEPAGEGWTLPIERGGGWEHPLEQSLEEKLDQIEEEEK